ncbi:hypothetical protein [Actinophytocola xinjiangensis]|uniref:hypothetical protein n=1 Tax=Actinophytocola xinjiangensis TaxID=485602 RepID=UPI0012B7C997|nr:hypothetical protein [Actinophytocola xinjiangensis]
MEHWPHRREGTGGISIKGRGIVKVKLGIEFSCAGVFPEIRRVQVMIILVVVLLAWSRGTLIAVI